MRRNRYRKREDLDSTGRYERTHPRTRLNLSDCGEGAELGRSDICKEQERSPCVQREEQSAVGVAMIF